MQAGDRLGPYDIVAPLGSGGMGEVYRARDTKLNREVALKVLPEAFTADPDRLARFKREAQVLASLNHPNIAAIYGLEESEAATPALVLELVEGPTLADEIARAAARGLDTNTALTIARQIAEALEAAHEQGIIHRDLKPANVKLRPDGTIKVLDFGLAKALEPAGGIRSDVTASPTITTPAMMTGMGVILGTAAYMAPEQAKGRPADKRSDVWAFGCVLYEMLTGRRAFEGEDVSDTLAAVLRAEPDWSALALEDRPAIKTLITRCLQKDRRRRIADMSTVLFVLDEPGVLSPAPATTTAAKPKRSIWKRALPFAITAALAGAVVGMGVWIAKPSAPEPAVTRFMLALGEGEQLSGAGRRQLAVSPDGTTLAYLVNDRLHVRFLSNFESRVVAEAERGLFSPVFSPDGRTLAFYSQTDKALKSVAVTGAAVAVTICPMGQPPVGLTWEDEGLLFSSGNGITRCSSEGGMPEQLASFKADELVHGPQRLPGGQTLLFTVSKISESPGRWDKAQIVAQDMKSGARKTLVAGTDGQYLPTGHLVYMQGGVLFAVPFDPRRLIVTGKAVPVIEGITRSAGANNGPAAQLAISATGTVIYIPGPAKVGTEELLLAFADRDGKVTRLTLPPNSYDQVRVSPDGKRLAIGTDDGKDANVWVYEIAGTSALRRLTLGGQNRFPVWSPDGEHVAFQSDREGDLAIFKQRADGTGAVERLTKPEKGDAHMPESWSRAGLLSYSVVRNGYSLWILSVWDKKTSPFGAVRSSEPIGSVFSPDGRWIAYHSGGGAAGAGRSPDAGVFIQPVPATNERYQLPKRALDFQPVWGPKGDELVWVPSAASGQLALVSVNTRSGVTFGNPVLVPARVTANRPSGLPRAFDILPDGRFVGFASASESQTSGSPNQYRIVLNWFEELKQRVPVK